MNSRDFTDMIWSASRYVYNDYEKKIKKEEIELFLNSFNYIDVYSENRIESMKREYYNVLNSSFPHNREALIMFIEKLDNIKNIKEDKDEKKAKVLNLAYLFAISYAIGRRTYVTLEAVDWTNEFINILTLETRKKIRKIIENCHDKGDSCDIENWEKILKIIT